ncbi:ThuA domain-containing protein [Microbacterium sp. zg-YB36]|uniref:ThuA domain-containing protein n=1 Tax=Microbacterium sp. zg-YB36 TaxID=2969407 RepID=UPI00214BE624|nr:ThuA domain-containing protein [Microbacterium sp. zg-YB36]MDL5352069.1 ThuA domain-containing protein [Microbacterium sp. zg-YB36]
MVTTTPYDRGAPGGTLCGTATVGSIMPSSPTALVLSGSGRYADPWHPFPRTTPLLAAALADAGFDTVISDDVDGGMARLDGVDLLVVNAGDPWSDDERTTTAPEASVLGLSPALDRGMGVLAMHCAVASLRDYPAWAPAIGGMWVPNASWHPEIGDIDIAAGELPDGTTLTDFTVFDERYCRLQQFGDRTVVATHETDGERMPAAWVRTYGPARVAVDTLGHDERSYDSAGHRRLIGMLARWAAGTA